MFPKTSHEGSSSEESYETIASEKSATAEDESSGVVAGTSSAAVTLGNDEGFAEGEGEEDAQDSSIVASAATSTSNSNGFLPSLLESDDSELEDFLDDILERGRNMLKKGNPMSKMMSSSG